MKLVLIALAALVASCFISLANGQDVPAYCSAGNFSCAVGQPCACRNNGTCTVTGVTCSCTPLTWSGLHCQTPVCSRRNNCNSGRCIAPDVCNCTGTGYQGDSCEVPICSPACANGLCIAPNSCSCTGTGYTGSLCEVPICDEIGGCLRGFCSAPNVCNCTGTGWSGINCEVPVCVNPCVNGICNGPNSCQCPSNFGGTYCETALCSPPCQNLGFCQPRPNNQTNICNCSNAIGWTGSYCDQPQCSQPCQNGGRCTGPNQCDCRGTGYAGILCQNEINECLGTPRPCSSVSNCTNTPGNYTCAPCPRGYNGTGYGLTTGCVDINECLLGRCDPLTNCTNTPGNFTCTPCPSGYSGTPQTGCVDIDECAQGLCSPHADCTNSPGSFNCSACYSGYRGSGYTSQGGCQDIDECTPPDRVCDPIVTCQNLDGSFNCADCPTGYTGTPLTGCVPICEPGCQNGGVCTRPNVCTCTGTGFTGQLCETDRNECLDPLSCDVLTNCTNEIGSYSCSDCPANYNGDGKTGCRAICNPPCRNGGVCSKPNECSCARNWAGDTCEEYVEDVSGSAILSLGIWASACIVFCFFFYV